MCLLTCMRLAAQQAEVIRSHTELRVGVLCGEMGVDFWQRGEWTCWLAEHQCIVLTPQLMLDALRHGFVTVRDPPASVLGSVSHAQVL